MGGLVVKLEGSFLGNLCSWRKFWHLELGGKVTLLFTQEAINKYGFFELLLVESKSDDILIEALLSNLNFP